jgi:trehalose/maltose transport system substrate-binding protein
VEDRLSKNCVYPGRTPRVSMPRRRALGLLAASLLPVSCGRGAGDDSARPSGPLRLVFKHQPLWGDPAPFRAVLEGFMREHPGVEVATEALPNASDAAHQYFLTALEGGARDFDVFVADVAWMPELARAGWVEDLSDVFPPEHVRRDFIPAAAETAILSGRTFALPWYVDVGILYRRTDLVPHPPETPGELAEMALAQKGRAGAVHGFVFQGRQYEGLVCNIFEDIWNHGGEAMQGERVLIDTPEARAALEWCRSLVVRGASPGQVTSMAEEESRRVFQDGRAVFMRNWPYAFAEISREGSPLRGKVGLSALPRISGGPGHGALGGYDIAVNKHMERHKREAAIAFVEHLCSIDAGVRLAIAYGRLPSRRATYDDPRLEQGAPLARTLLPMVEQARPRPPTPYWPMISDTLQAEFSAALSGIRAPAAALRRAQALIDHVMGAL